MPSVKIAIDIRRMTEFGVGTYIRNVVRTLGRLDHETTYFLLGPSAKVKEIGPLPANFHTVRSGRAGAFAQELIANSALWSSGWSATWSTFRICFRAARSALPVCDDGTRYSRASFAGPRAHRVLADSALSVDQAGAERSGAHFRGLELHQDRKSRSYLAFLPAVSRLFITRSTSGFLHGHANPADRQLIAERYQVTYPFLLYAGRISPHKNVVRMIEAFSALKTELEKEHSFLI